MNDNKLDPAALQAEMDQDWAKAVDWYENHRPDGSGDYVLDLAVRLATPLPHAFLGMSPQMLQDVKELAKLAIRDINLRALLRWQEKRGLE